MQSWQEKASAMSAALRGPERSYGHYCGPMQLPSFQTQKEQLQLRQSYQHPPLLVATEFGALCSWLAVLSTPRPKRSARVANYVLDNRWITQPLHCVHGNKTPPWPVRSALTSAVKKLTRDEQKASRHTSVAPLAVFWRPSLRNPAWH